MSTMPAYDGRELLITTIARLLAGCRHVAVGAASPIPAAGAMLARLQSDRRMTVSLLGSERHNAFTDGGRELFDCAAQGRIDAFFLSGVQIDGQGNVNLLGLGTPGHLDKRFSGNFGSSYLAFLVPRLILFREEHNPRTLVERVDFISAPGTSAANVFRPGGPKALLTGRCLFAFKSGGKTGGKGGGFELTSLHPGQGLEEVRAATGFSFVVPAAVGVTAEPQRHELELIRGPILRELEEVYPRFSASLSA